MSLSPPDEQVAAQRLQAAKVRGYDKKIEEELRRTGTVPLCLRIGVTGHRDIRDPDRVQEEVARIVLQLIAELRLDEVSQHSPIWLQVLTPLAAGADQIVAEAVLGLDIAGTALMVPLPADEDSYVRSIRDDDPAAADRYQRLRRNAKVTRLAGTTADEAGFRKLGEWIVDHCDALIALWDGQPPPPASPAGPPPPGTAAIVSYALSHPREIPVIVVPVTRNSHRGPSPDVPPGQLLLRTEHGSPFVDLWWRVRGMHGSEPSGLSPRLAGQTDEEREAEFQQAVRSWPLDASGGRVLRRNFLGVAVDQVRRLNTHSHPDQESWFSALVDKSLGSSTGAIPEAARKIEEWASARFGRADLLASRYQKFSRRLDRSIYVLAALAVLVAGTRAIWATPGSAVALLLTYLDVAILLSVSVILVGDLRGRVRDRWVCFRAMAEYLRTDMFLALIDPRTKTSAIDDQSSLTSLGLNEFVGPAWYDRSMKAIWLHRPPVQPPWSDGDLPALKRVLCGWILDQEGYHYTKSKEHAVTHRRFTAVVAALFIVTVLAALVHLVATGDQVDDWLNFVAIGVPGVGAAVNSIAASGEHHRHSVRSRAAMHRLSYQYLPEIRGATSVRQLRKRADILGRYTLGESTEWYEVMAVHSVDIPT